MFLTKRDTIQEEGERHAEAFCLCMPVPPYTLNPKPRVRYSCTNLLVYSPPRVGCPCTNLLGG
jgi:hypothetical protein